MTGAARALGDRSTWANLQSKAAAVGFLAGSGKPPSVLHGSTEFADKGVATLAYAERPWLATMLGYYFGIRPSQAANCRPF